MTISSILSNHNLSIVKVLNIVSMRQLLFSNRFTVTIKLFSGLDLSSYLNWDGLEHVQPSAEHTEPL